ncbi:hypothetical protein DICPUDRAFT_147362 [Dictyostelium purpureum]|uniref:Uncharacterized protein n=1 Tax=Dictyostelium purpureum TaxID=5786 RepID=F0Z8B3_DICPU|nr:uncharacterized protein DICPUDRAFT_147362 [Dictyostelium purpureum]EGC39786.1 hypothetical protein DICPUDRAFT_147362 [Dictyostelium purpureum]|eukprot:XP_003283653.1 hypothetical protein DICPUDRAFT_147362 [Dictyostelium purpureum]
MKSFFCMNIRNQKYQNLPSTTTIKLLEHKDYEKSHLPLTGKEDPSTIRSIYISNKPK